MGHEPAYQLLSFCPTISCMKNGTDKMKQRGVEFPLFEGEIGVKDRSKEVEKVESQLSGFATLLFAPEYLLEEEHYVLRHE